MIEPTTRSLRFREPSGTEYITTSLGVSESINAPYVTKSTILSEGIITRDVIGKPGCFLFRENNGDGQEGNVHTVCHGLIRSLHGRPPVAYINMNCWEIIVVPWFDLLRENINCRIFQEASLVDIIQQIVDQYTFEHPLTFTTQPTAIKTLCIQHQESDYDFITRLLFEEGFHFYFVYNENGHEMVIGNDNQAFRDAPIKEVCLRSIADKDATPKVESWCVRNELVGGSWEYTGYNPELGQAMTSRCVVPENRSGVADGMRWESRQSSQEPLDEAALRCMENHERNHATVSSSCRLPHLHAGLRFTMKGHPESSQNGVHIIHTMDHHFSCSDFSSFDNIQYESTFTCFPESTVFRSSPLTRKIMGGVQKATVYGPEGAETHSDESGRVQVLFHWDKNGEFPCWLPVRQSFAGDGYGSSILPRVGHQVVIDFFDGDPDQPFVSGSLYTAINEPVEVSVETLILRTRSTPGGKEEDGHIFRVCDTKDSEEFFIQAQKDMLCQVKNNMNMTVTGDSLAKVEKTLSMTSTGLTTIASEEGIVIESGGNKIELSATGITMTGINVAIEGQVQTEIKAGVALVQQGGIVKIN